MKKQLLAIFLLIVCFFYGKSQDIHFSQYYNSPTTFNPALIGDYDGDMRFSLSFREQWRTIGEPFQTTAAGVEIPFYYFTERFGVALNVINDRSGNVMLNVNKAYLSLGYQKNYRNHQFKIGIQPGYVSKIFDPGNSAFPDQYNRKIGQFDATSLTSETFPNQSLQYFDLNFGLGWMADYGKVKPRAGISMFHLNKPTETFFNGNNKLPIRNSIFVASDFYIQEKFMIEATSMYMEHSNASFLIPGINFHFLLFKESQGIYSGLQYRAGMNRNSDAAIAVVGLNMKRYRAGISYDVNISDLNLATNSRGAIEFSFIYKTKSSIPNKLSVPCEHY